MTPKRPPTLQQQKRAANQAASLLASPEYLANAVLDSLGQTAHEMEVKWGIGRLRPLVPPELCAKFDIQRDKLDAAARSGSSELVTQHGAEMKRAYEALEKAAVDAGASAMSQQVAESPATKPGPPIGMEIGDEGTLQGKNPLDLPAEIYASLGHEPQPILSAIRKKCLDCCGEAPSEVRRCTSVKCALWPYRMGSNPFRKSRELTEEEKRSMRDRLAAARAQKAEARE
jgi:hypothetical protein